MDKFILKRIILDCMQLRNIDLCQEIFDWTNCSCIKCKSNYIHKTCCKGNCTCVYSLFINLHTYDEMEKYMYLPTPSQTKTIETPSQTTKIRETPSQTKTIHPVKYEKCYVKHKRKSKSYTYKCRM